MCLYKFSFVVLFVCSHTFLLSRHIDNNIEKYNSVLVILVSFLFLCGICDLGDGGLGAAVLGVVVWEMGVWELCFFSDDGVVNDLADIKHIINYYLRFFPLI